MWVVLVACCCSAIIMLVTYCIGTTACLLCVPIMLLHRVPFVFSLIPAGIFAQQPHSALASESGVYDSSQTPPTLPWNTYNYCNAPHVNPAHYELPDIGSMGGAKLVHVSVIMRHHKVCACHCHPRLKRRRPTATLPSKSYVFRQNH